MALTMLQLHILKTYISQYQNAKGQSGEGGGGGVKRGGEKECWDGGVMHIQLLLAGEG